MTRDANHIPPGGPIGPTRAGPRGLRSWWVLGACAGTLAGCVATAPVAPNAASTASAATVEFGAERSAQLRQRLERGGWGFLVSSVSRSNAGEPPTEFFVFVDPASVARYGNIARARVLHSYARPVAGSAATISFQQFDCAARTLQATAMDRFSDSEATLRISSSNLTGQLLPVAPRSLGEVLFNSVCVGRFARGTGTGGAPTATARPPAAAQPGGAAPTTPPRASTGSGIAIATGLVLTNAHVVARCGSVEVTHQGRRLPASIRQRDERQDLALLAAADLPEMPYPALRQQANVGEAVMVAGYPLAGLLSSDLIVTDGIVNALSGIGDRDSHLQMSAAVQPGNSGGPLLDRGGNLVGVVVAKLNALATMVVTGDLPQNVNFAIKPERVSAFLQGHGVQPRAATAVAALDTQQVAAAARGFTVKVDCKP